MDNIAKFEIQVIHQDQVYKVTLGQADEKDPVKLSVAGRSVKPCFDSPVPKSLDVVFASLNNKSFATEKELVSELKGQKDIVCLSVTKKVYQLGTFALIDHTFKETKTGAHYRQEAFEKLNTCSSSPREVGAAVVRCRVPPAVLFEIADQLEGAGKPEVAKEVREAGRPFNLASATQHICDQITAHCVKPDVGAKAVEGLQNKLAEGVYDKIHDRDDFVNIVSDHLIEITNDRHFFLVPKGDVGAPSAAPSDDAVIKQLNGTNFGFGEFRTPKGGTAYLGINKLENPRITVGGETLTRDFALAMMKQLVDSKPEAVIFDLRGNEGGSPYMVELIASHFMPAEQELTTFKYREKPKLDEIDFPQDPTKTWSYADLPEDRRLLDVPVYVLTDHRTFSAGEDFACHFKETKRAVLIGETTGGGGDPNRLYDAGEFYVAIPFGLIQVPYGAGWDGVGISPHVEVSEGQDAAVIASQMIKRK